MVAVDLGGRMRLVLRRAADERAAVTFGSGLSIPPGPQFDYRAVRRAVFVEAEEAGVHPRAEIGDALLERDMCVGGDASEAESVSMARPRLNEDRSPSKSATS